MEVGLSSPSTEPLIAEAEERSCSEVSEGQGVKIAPKVDDAGVDKLVVWMVTKVQGEGGFFTPTQYLSPLWAHQALWLSERHWRALAEGQGMSHQVNVQVNNDSIKPDTQVSNTKLPLASFYSTWPFPGGRAPGVATGLN